MNPLHLKNICVLAVAALLSASIPAGGQVRVSPDIWLPLIDGPSGQAAYYKPVESKPSAPDPAWLHRTGSKKGIRSLALAVERWAAPDAAVLKSGFHGPWQGLLLEFQESSVLVDADHVAGLAKTKPYLIIPSGALAGTSGSAFFKAGLEEFVKAGGTLICFAQQTGTDFSVLPVPQGAKLEALGWLQDAGPLFRASSIVSRHALLSGTDNTTPGIETSGYFSAYPPGSQVLLSRSDGYPTMIVYSHGAGRVLLSSLFSDFSLEQGQLDTEEKNLLRDILRWAKSPDQVIMASAGERIKLDLMIQEPGQNAASSIRILVTGPDAGRVLAEETLAIPVSKYQTLPIAYTFAVPADARPGIYHIQYRLQDANGNAMSHNVETRGSIFSIGHPAISAPIPRIDRPLAGILSPVTMQPLLEREDNMLRLRISITADPKAALPDDQAFLLKAAGRQKSFSLMSGKASFSIDVPLLEADSPVPFALYQANGRSLARGTFRADASPKTGIVLNAPAYSAGQKLTLAAKGLGTGEFTLQAPGRIEKQMIPGEGIVPYAIPAALPTGTYALQWKMDARAGSSGKGQALLNLSGYRVRVTDAYLDTSASRGTLIAKVRLRISATRTIAAHAVLRLRGPDGKIVPLSEGPIALVEGEQDLPLSFSFKPSQSGIGELLYTVDAKLPPGPGLNSESVSLAAGRILFDIGRAALLNLSSSQPVHYEPTGPIDLTAEIFGTGRVRLDLFLDNKKVKQVKFDLAGAVVSRLTISEATGGPHVLKAVLSDGDLESLNEFPFLYGTGFPDLTAGIEAPAPDGLILPVSVSITNQGNIPSGPTRAALYENGAPPAGSLIAAADIPPLEPGGTHKAFINWPLAGRAGSRTILAVVDSDHTLTETDKSNNLASASVIIPAFLQKIMPRQKDYPAADSIAFSLFTANLSTVAYRNNHLNLELRDNTDKVVASDTIRLPDLAPGAEYTLDHQLIVPSLPAGTYRISAQAAGRAPAAADIGILPTLKLRGSLEETASTAVLCQPFSLKYNVTNAGNLPVHSGSISLEIRSSPAGTVPAFSRQLPFKFGKGSVSLEKSDLPPGVYLISLKAAIVNEDREVTRLFSLAEKPLIAKTPVEVSKGGPVLRTLVLLGNIGSAVQQALAEKIVNDALDDAGAYHQIVSRYEDFSSLAESGQFTTYILFESDEMITQLNWLRTRIEQGHTLIIIGPGDNSKRLAEAFGFTFNQAIDSSGALLTFPRDAGMELTGMLPISGRTLMPSKKGARPLAFYEHDKAPAVLVDRIGMGQVMVMPFSLTRSALDTAATSFYTLLFRSAVLGAGSRNEDASDIGTEELAAASSGGPVKTRIVVTLPLGSTIIWTAGGGAVNGSVITFDLIADRIAQKLAYIYQPRLRGSDHIITEVFYECSGNMVRQGKLE